MVRQLLINLVCVVLATRACESRAEVHVESSIVQPFSIVFDPSNVAYGVSFERSNDFFTITNDFEVAFIAGGPGREGRPAADGSVGDGGILAKARFKGMHDLAISPDGTVVYIADTFNNRVRIADLKHRTISTLIGGETKGFADGSLSDAKINQPFTVDIDPAGKNLLIADLKNYRVREIDLVAKTIRTVAGNGKRGTPNDGDVAVESPLVSPRAAIYAPDGSIYIASREGNAVRQVTADGLIRTVVNRSGKKGYAGDGAPAIEALLSGPKHLSLDPNGDVVIADDQNHCIRLYRRADETIHLLAGQPQTPGQAISDDPLQTQLQRPHGARYDKLGRLWICDSWNDRLLRFD